MKILYVYEQKPQSPSTTADKTAHWKGIFGLIEGSNLKFFSAYSQVNAKPFKNDNIADNGRSFAKHI